MKTKLKQTNDQGKPYRLVSVLCLLLTFSPGLWAEDADNDFMEDQWEVQHGLDPGDPNDAFTDLDQDSFANLSEFLHGSAPDDDGQVPEDNATMLVPTQVGTIQHAIDMSINGDSVVVQPGTYQEGLVINNREVHVKGSAPDDPTVVAATIINPGVAYYDVVTLLGSQKTSSILEGLTLTGGQMGVFCQGIASPKIARCTITENSATGIYINGHTDAEVTVSHCRVMANANDGIVCRASRLHLRHTVVAKNGNEWSTGVYMYDGVAGRSRVHNCTIVGHGYRGIRINNTGTDLPNISNCIVWDNRDDLVDCSAIFSCIQDGDPGLGNRFEEPRFVDLTAHDFRLLPESLCIDGGAPWSDYGAELTPNGDRVNMGAYGNTPLAAPSTDADGDGISDNWERHYWPADDPGVHNPEDDEDADGFDNRTEYLYGYDPTIASQATLGVVKAQVAPEQFDPTAQETLTIRYWLNTDASVTIQVFADADPQNPVQTIAQSGPAGENALQWHGRDSHGDILERGWYSVVAEADANGTLSQAQSNASQLQYDHRVLELVCQPQRFFPLHNEITRITYHAVPDAPMLVKIYDPNDNLFCTRTLEASDPNEILWQGTDKDLGDPAGRYLSQPGTYRIEALFQGMFEKNETRVEAYR